MYKHKNCGNNLSREGKMELKAENKFITFIKRFGYYILGGIIVLALILTATLVGVFANKHAPAVDVDTNPLVFGLPTNGASVIKDFSDTKLQFNETLNKWEAHYSVDLAGDDLNVLAVLDGKVSSVDYKYMSGYTVTIAHTDGFESVYASLDESVQVKAGDTVSKGQILGQMSTSAAGESTYGAHLDFTLKQNGKEVDPNNYIALQNK